MSAADSSNSPLFSPGKAPALARAVTLAQLAKYVGVSSAAVSVVLNNNTESRIKVSEETRQRILVAARELNYQPNALARSLMKRKTDVIGFYNTQPHMIDPLFPFLSALLQGMLVGCRDNERNLLMYGQVATINEDDLYLEVLNGQLDGLVLFAWTPNLFTKRLTESHLPVVTVADEVPGLPCVGVDDDLGGRLLARYVAEKGYRRALYWTLPNALSTSMEMRRASYLDEAAKCGLRVEVFQEQHPFEPHLEKIMARKEPPDVISVYCDHAVCNVIQALKNIGLQVPRDIAVTGFDGVPGSYPTFTTVRAPWKEVAHTAVSLLVQQCEGKAIPMRTSLPVELIIGETA